MESKQKYLSYLELLNMNNNEKVLVNADEFYRVYPKLIKMDPANISIIKSIYKSVVYNTSTKKVPFPTDMITLRVPDAIFYFEKVQDHISSTTFKSFKSEPLFKTKK